MKLSTVLKTGTVVLILGTLGYVAWWYTRQPVDTTAAVVAKPAPVVAKVKKKVVPVKQVVVYAPEAKAKLKLPTSILNDNMQHVTGATVVSPSERRVTVTSVLDERTGETTTFTKAEPYPWLAVESRGEARLDYGYKLAKAVPVPVPVARLSITHNFVQVKALHAGVNVAVDSDGSAFAGVGLSYKW